MTAEPTPRRGPSPPERQLGGSRRSDFGPARYQATRPTTGRKATTAIHMIFGVVSARELMIDLATKGVVTLVYGARDEAHNDAVVLRDMLLSDDS